MSSRLRLRALSTVLALGILALAASPAAAATEVAKGAASALTVSVAGNAQGTGTYTASNDGTSETTSGNRTPAVTILGGFAAAGAGTLNQVAGTTTASRSTACAGLAGNGATLVAVGQSRCLEPKDTLALNAGTVNFSTLGPDPQLVTTAFNQALADNIPEPARTTFATSISSVAAQLSSAFTQGFAALGNPALSLNLGVIQGRCAALPGDATGSSQLLGAQVIATFPSQAKLPAATLLDLDSSPAPNTPFRVGVGQLLVTAISSLQTSLTSSLTTVPGAGPLQDVVTALAAGSDPVKQAITQITSQLGPLDQVISGTLNKQSRPDDSSIDVTALDLNVLPAAAQAINAPLANLQVGHVSCAAANVARVDAPVAAPAVADADVPSVIDSGLPGDSHADLYRTLLGVLLLVGAGGIAVRRLLVARSSD